MSWLPGILRAYCKNSLVYNYTRPFDNFKLRAIMNDSRERQSSSHWAVVNGVRMHYVKSGDGPHDLLLLPGALGSSSTDFSLQLENLSAKEFTMVAPDPRGYGLSRPPDRDWPDDFYRRDAEDAAKLMEETRGRGAKYSILGWSDGGILALMIAGMYPERLRKLVVFGANAFVGTEDVAKYEAVRDVDKWSEAMSCPFEELYGKEYFKIQWNNWMDTVTRYYWNGKKGDICKDEVEKITCPTLIIHGDKDALVPACHVTYLNEKIQNSTVYRFPDGKHNLHMKYYKEFNCLVEKFLLGTGLSGSANSNGGDPMLPRASNI